MRLAAGHVPAVRCCSTSFGSTTRSGSGMKNHSPCRMKALLCGGCGADAFSPLAGLGRQHLPGLEGLHRRADGGHARASPARPRRTSPARRGRRGTSASRRTADGSRRAAGADAAGRQSRTLPVTEPSSGSLISKTSLRPMFSHIELEAVSADRHVHVGSHDHEMLLQVFANMTRLLFLTLHPVPRPGVEPGTPR